MPLVLEQRRADGVIHDFGQFIGGEVELGDGRKFTVEQARQLAKVSGHLELKEREWALRVVEFSKSGLLW